MKATEYSDKLSNLFVKIGSRETSVFSLEKVCREGFFFIY